MSVDDDRPSAMWSRNRSLGSFIYCFANQHYRKLRSSRDLSLDRPITRLKARICSLHSPTLCLTRVPHRLRRSLGRFIVHPAMVNQNVTQSNRNGLQIPKLAPASLCITYKWGQCGRKSHSRGLPANGWSTIEQVLRADRGHAEKLQIPKKYVHLSTPKFLKLHNLIHMLWSKKSCFNSCKCCSSPKNQLGNLVSI